MINNTVLNHNSQQKYTFENTDGQRSLIDIVVTKRHYKQIIICCTLKTTIYCFARITYYYNMLIWCKYKIERMKGND